MLHNQGKCCNYEFLCNSTDSLAVWGSEGKRGVWIKIPLEQSELIAPAARVGGAAELPITDV